MIQGGASGSPVFLPDTGAVVGMQYAGLVDIQPTKNRDFVRVPTNISHALPAHVLADSMKCLEKMEELRASDDAQTLEEMMESAKLVERGTEDDDYYSIVPARSEDHGGPINLTVRRQ